MTSSIATLPQIFPGLKSLALVMNCSGQFIIPGNTLADQNQIIALLGSGQFSQVFLDLFKIVNAMANVKLAQKSVYDPVWSDGPVSFNGSRKAALARLLDEEFGQWSAAIEHCGHATLPPMHAAGGACVGR
jgi:hypothetical protein